MTEEIKESKEYGNYIIKHTVYKEDTGYTILTKLFAKKKIYQILDKTILSELIENKEGKSIECWTEKVKLNQNYRTAMNRNEKKIDNYIVEIIKGDKQNL